MRSRRDVGDTGRKGTTAVKVTSDDLSLLARHPRGTASCTSCTSGAATRPRSGCFAVSRPLYAPAFAIHVQITIHIGPRSRSSLLDTTPGCRARGRGVSSSAGSRAAAGTSRRAHDDIVRRLEMQAGAETMKWLETNQLGSVDLAWENRSLGKGKNDFCWWIVWGRRERWRERRL